MIANVFCALAICAAIARVVRLGMDPRFEYMSKWDVAITCAAWVLVMVTALLAVIVPWAVEQIARHLK